jgi:hypothetical protein
MISKELREFVNKAFPTASDDSDDEDGENTEFREDIFATLEDGQSLLFLGKTRGCDISEILLLKRIEEAYLTNIVPDKL